MANSFIEINTILAQFTSNVDQTVSSTIQSAAKEGVSKLKATSPQGASGKYAKSWAVKKSKGTHTIYNKQPGLTHLLENGHDVIRNGQKVGEAKPHPHIKAVDDWLGDEIISRLEKNL